MQLPEDQVRWVAKLAQIELTEQEKHSFAADLSNTISYIDELNQVELAAIDSSDRSILLEVSGSQITGLANVMQADEIRNCELPRDEFLQRAPKSANGFIEVKKVL